MSIARRKILGKRPEQWPLVIRYPGPDGRTRTETIKSGLKKDAERRLREIENEKDLGVHVPKSATKTVGLALTMWLDHYEVLVRRGIKRESTLDNYRRTVRLHLLPEFGGILLTMLDPLHVQRWVEELLTAQPFARRGGKRVRGRQYSLSAIRTIPIPLKLALDFAVEHKLVGRNVLKDRPIRYPEAPDDVREFPDFEDIRKIVVALDQRQGGGARGGEFALSFRNRRVMFYLAMFGGLRMQEVCGLQWSSVGFERRELQVRHTMTRDGRIVPQVKAKASKRTVPINDLLYQVLLAHAQMTGDRTGCVVRNRSDRPQGLAQVIAHHVPLIMTKASLLKDDGKHKYTFHQLRHFAGSAWLAQGMPIDEVSRLLGHARIEITRNVYIHQLEHDTRARTAIERVSALISGKPMPAVPAPPATPAIEHLAASHEVNGVPAVPTVVDSASLPLMTLAGLREQQRQRALAMWKEGRTHAEICAEIGVSNVTVSEWVQQAHGNLHRLVLRTARYERLTPEQRAAKRRRERESYHRRKAAQEKRDDNVTRDT